MSTSISRVLTCLTVWCSVFGGWLMAQSNAVILSTSPQVSGGILLAPGEITTFFVTGLTLSPSEGAKAAGAPLPTTLAGISGAITAGVTTQQGFGDLRSVSLPLLEAKPQHQRCFLTQPCTQVIAVT